MNRLDNILYEVFIRNHLIRLANFLAEAWIICALLFPNVLLSPSINHLEPLHEEYAQVFRLIIRAAVNSWSDTHDDLAENIQKINLWDSKLNQ